MKTKHCGGCGKDLPIDRFSLNRTTSDGLNGWCRDCKGKHNSARNGACAKLARELRERAVEYKGGACKDSHLGECRGSLQFDHRGKKRISMTSGRSSGGAGCLPSLFSVASRYLKNPEEAWVVVRLEADGCELVCALHHRLRTKSERERLSPSHLSGLVRLTRFEKHLLNAERAAMEVRDTALILPKVEAFYVRIRDGSKAKSQLSLFRPKFVDDELATSPRAA